MPTARRRAQKNDVARELQQNQYVKPRTACIYVSKEQALADMKKRHPELVKNLPSNPLADSLEVTPNRARGRRQALQLDRRSRASRRASTRCIDGKQVSHRILQVAHVIEAVFTIATRDLADRVDPPDREHDPALDLLAAT